LEFLPALPGQAHFTRQMEHMVGGRVDLLRRLIELCAIAQKLGVKVILSSWYYLHTFWFTEDQLTAELLGLPREERFMRFARGLDHILRELTERGLADTIASAEIFNEVDGMDFGGPAEQPTYRALHEEALDFLKSRHPAIPFAVDTCTPWTKGKITTAGTTIRRWSRPCGGAIGKPCPANWRGSGRPEPDHRTASAWVGEAVP